MCFKVIITLHVRFIFADLIGNGFKAPRVPYVFLKWISTRHLWARGECFSRRLSAKSA